MPHAGPKKHFKEEGGEGKQLQMEQWTLALCVTHSPLTFTHLTMLWTSDQTSSFKSLLIPVAELPADQSSPYSQILGSADVSCGLDHGK